MMSMWRSKFRFLLQQQRSKSSTASVVVVAASLAATAAAAVAVVETIFCDSRPRLSCSNKDFHAATCSPDVCNCTSSSDSSTSSLDSSSSSSNVRKKLHKSTLDTNREQWKHRVSGVEVALGGGGQVRSSRSNLLLGHVRAWIDVTWRDGLGRTGERYIQFEYTGCDNGSSSGDDYEDDAAAAEVHWIQFIRRKKWYRSSSSSGNEEEQKKKKGNHHSFIVDTMLWHRRNEWFLDAPRSAKRPYYDEYGMHNRRSRRFRGSSCSNVLCIFDKPRGVFDPAIHSKYLIEFETFLVYKENVVYRIQWEYVKSGTEEGYRNIRGSQVDSIPEEFAGTVNNNSSNNTTGEGKCWKVGYRHRCKTDPEHTIYIRATY